MSTEKIVAALKQLEPQNENHWTADGLARIETVRFLAKDQGITREDITRAAPDFTRTVPLFEDEVGAQPPSSKQENGDGPQQTQEQRGLGSDAQGEALQGLDADLAAARAALDESAARKAAADQEHETRRKEVDRLLEAIDKARPREMAHAAVTGYLARQRSLQVERAERANKFKAAGGVELLKAILPHRAPIDNALRTRKRA